MVILHSYVNVYQRVNLHEIPPFQGPFFTRIFSLDARLTSDNYNDSEKKVGLKTFWNASCGPPIFLGMVSLYHLPKNGETGYGLLLFYQH